MVTTRFCPRVTIGLAMLAACSPIEMSIVEVRGLALGTTYSVKFVGREDQRRAVEAAIDATIREVDRDWSTYRSDSVIARFNALRSTEPIEVGALIATVLARALRIAAATDGAFDPTIGSVTKLHPLSGRGRSQPPTDAEIDAALAAVGHRHLEIVDGTRIRKLRAELEIDPNAFAKGWAVDRVSAALETAGLREHLVEIGGEVVCRGRKPGGAVWRVGIESPDDPEGLGDTVALVDAALATSGSYRQFFESGGRKVHHIVDPRTGRNALGNAVSVSVRAGDCTLADALATALMVTGPQAAPRIAEALGEPFHALFLIRGESGGIERREFAW